MQSLLETLDVVYPLLVILEAEQSLLETLDAVHVYNPTWPSAQLPSKSRLPLLPARVAHVVCDAAERMHIQCGIRKQEQEAAIMAPG